MRPSSLLISLVLFLAAGAASADTSDVKSRVGYIPAPAAKSAGRQTVIQALRKLGKEEFENAKEVDGCCNVTFEAKVLLDTSSLFSLEVSNYWNPPGRATQGGASPLLFDMTTGREYDVSRLYHVRDSEGALLASLRKVVASRMDPKKVQLTPQQVAEWVEDDLSRGSPYLYVTKTGIRVWPEAAQVWLDDVVLTWKDLRSFLDVAEAKRLGWHAR